MSAKEEESTASSSSKKQRTEKHVEEENPMLIHQTGQCLCGAVKFTVKGTILFNELCHCRACGRARGMTPVHLIGVKGDFTVLRQEEDKVKTVPGMGTMTHTMCSQCGGGLYQRPAGATFYAVFPTTFQLETPVEGRDVPSGMLPPHLQPKAHHNYENRLCNHYDALPKYKTFPGSPKMTNEGEIIKEE